MAQGRAHNDETRAAVIAALLTGQGVNEVAREYNLPKSTVSRIKSEIDPEKLEQVGTQKKRDFGELLGSYLERLIRTLEAQAAVAGDPEYIRKQPASELATLHGVMADKGIRLLEAAQAFDDEPG